MHYEPRPASGPTPPFDWQVMIDYNLQRRNEKGLTAETASTYRHFVPIPPEVDLMDARDYFYQEAGADWVWPHPPLASASRPQYLDIAWNDIPDGEEGTAYAQLALEEYLDGAAGHPAANQDAVTTPAQGDQ